MDQRPAELRERTKQFALRIIRLYQALPRAGEARVLGHQLLRCGTSVAANYRAACRARSKAEFVSRISIVAEEADESVLWLELLLESSVLPAKRLDPLLKEAHALAAIFTAAEHTSRENAKSIPQLRNSASTQSQKRAN